MNWRSEAGASNVMLLAAWGVLMVCLAFSFDFALNMVFRQQLQTALEAGATAGARQVKYDVKARVGYHTTFYWDCYGSDGKKNTCWTHLDNSSTVPYAWGGGDWRQRYSMLCGEGTGWTCFDETIVSCKIVEKADGAAREAALQVFAANSSRWDKFSISGEKPTVSPPTVDVLKDQEGRLLEVDLKAHGEMPTLFLRYIDAKWTKLPVDVAVPEIAAKPVWIGKKLDCP